MQSTAVNNLRLVTSRCVGSGSALNMPQSALEAITSLDPKDYEYPKPSPAQQQAALAQFEAFGTFSFSAGCYGSSDCAYNSSPFCFPSLKSSLPDVHAAVRSTHFEILPVADEAGIASVLNLDLDPDCLKLLNAAASGDISDASTMTTGISGDAGRCELLKGPNSPSATSPALHQPSCANQRCDEEEDDDDELLVSLNTEGLTNAVDLSDSNLLATDMLRVLCYPMSKKQKDLISDHPSGCTSSSLLKPLKLSLDYEAAALSMNAILASDTPEEKNNDDVVMHRQGSLKRQRSK